ncbi:hypothetical protein C4B68_08830 [Streptomyces dengpaensis]|uniref:ATP-binding protein n=1 Tax=Streptomyces dengpaensis TaxID=2049881 RepID=A0ABN5HYL5_9ACTN|nr:hypothetical protein C4B68_08830 [Streptomyces dengpaensis]
MLPESRWRHHRQSTRARRRSPVYRPTSFQVPPDDDASVRGLVLVDALADRWCVEPRLPVGKTVWAEVAVRRRGDAESRLPPPPPGGS